MSEGYVTRKNFYGHFPVLLYLFVCFCVCYQIINKHEIIKKRCPFISIKKKRIRRCFCNVPAFSNGLAYLNILNQRIINIAIVVYMLSCLSTTYREKSIMSKGVARAPISERAHSRGSGDTPKGNLKF